MKGNELESPKINENDKVKTSISYIQRKHHVSYQEAKLIYESLKEKYVSS